MGLRWYVQCPSCGSLKHISDYYDLTTTPKPLVILVHSPAPELSYLEGFAHGLFSLACLSLFIQPSKYSAWRTNSSVTSSEETFHPHQPPSGLEGWVPLKLLLPQLCTTSSLVLPPASYPSWGEVGLALSASREPQHRYLRDIPAFKESHQTESNSSAASFPPPSWALVSSYHWGSVEVNRNEEILSRPLFSSLPPNKPGLLLLWTSWGVGTECWQWGQLRILEAWSEFLMPKGFGQGPGSCIFKSINPFHGHVLKYESIKPLHG